MIIRLSPPVAGSEVKLFWDTSWNPRPRIRRQETAFGRSLPDRIRGRISTLDRGAEMTIFGLVSYATSGMMLYITPQTLTIISGLISGMAGVVWFVRERKAGQRQTKELKRPVG